MYNNEHIGIIRYKGGFNMNNKELRKLSRREILEILLEQTNRIEELETELEKVKNELSERKSNLKNIGSLAEASLVLSNIFKSADEAADIYMKNIKELGRKEEKRVRKELKELKKNKIEEIEKQCEKRLLEVEKEIKKMQKNNNEVKDISKKSSKKSTKKVDKIEVKEEKVNE